MSIMEHNETDIKSILMIIFLYNIALKVIIGNKDNELIYLNIEDKVRIDKNDKMQIKQN